VDAINNAGWVVFWAETTDGGQRISARNIYDGPIYTLVDTADGIFGGLDSAPQMNRAGTVVFTANLTDSGRYGLFTIADGVVTPIAGLVNPSRRSKMPQVLTGWAWSRSWRT
jgi:hypothetical protein